MIYNKNSFRQSILQKLQGCIPMLAGVLCLILLITFCGKDSGSEDSAATSSPVNNSAFSFSRISEFSASQPSPTVSLPPLSTTENSDKKTVSVYITGSVADPGVFELPINSIVADAVELAGGFTDDADDTSINMVYTITENTMIIVKSKSDYVGNAISSIQTGSGAYGSDIIKIDINSAPESEFTLLDGIGSSLAARIVSYRTNNGPFSCVEDLMNVSGIGERKFSAIKENICVR